MIKYRILFALDTEKDKPDARLRMRLTWAGGNLVSINVGYRVDKSKWIKEAARCKSNTTHGPKHILSSVINQEIQRYEDAANEIMGRLFKKEAPSADVVRSELQKALNISTPSNKTPVANDFNLYIRTLGLTKTETYLHSIKVAKNSLLRYNPNLTYDDLNTDGFNNYLAWVSENAQNGSIKRYIYNIKTFLNWCVKKGIDTGRADLNYEPDLKILKKPIIFLKWDEIMTFYNIELSGTDDLIRDMYCFGCFTSLRSSDVYRLRQGDIYDGVIHIQTQKTNTLLNIELNKYSEAIAKKYMTGKPGDLLFPWKLDKKYNNYCLRRAVAKCGFNDIITIRYYKANQLVEKRLTKGECITFHTSRKTFVSQALMMGIPAEIVMKWTGHSSIQTMRPYIDIANEEKAKAMTLFNR